MANRSHARCLPLLAALALAACDVRVGEQGVSVGVARGKAADEWVRTYPMPPGAQLEIANVNGAVNVTGVEGSSAEVRITREAEAASDEAARAAIERVEILEQAGDERIKVEIRRPGRAEGFGGWRDRVAVTYEVRLPKGAAASFRTENGPVKLEGVSGRLSATTANGTITGRSLSGGITASVVNGGVLLAFDSVTGPITITTVNGQVRLELPKDVKADLSASAVNGNVSVDEDLTFSASGAIARAPGVNTVEGRLGAGGAMISARTTNGQIRIAALEPSAP